MDDDLGRFPGPRPPDAARPLLGLTVLAVEDSRFACEALRLLCLRSGARLRRADCLRSARRHLATYRPAAVIVDLGLPDGSGEELIAELARAVPRLPAILGASGDPGAEARARAAGADGFLAKPVAGLAAFQAALLAALPPEARPKGLRPLSDEVVTPDPLALVDDLAQAAEALAAEDETRLDYIAQFLGGVAASAADRPLAAACAALAEDRRAGRPVLADLGRIAGLVQARLAAASGF